MEFELEETELLRLGWECSISRTEVRKEWAELLEPPRLEHLSRYSTEQNITHAIPLGKLLPHSVRAARRAPEITHCFYRRL